MESWGWGRDGVLRWRGVPDGRGDSGEGLRMRRNGEGGELKFRCECAQLTGLCAM